MLLQRLFTLMMVHARTPTTPALSLNSLNLILQSHYSLLMHSLRKSVGTLPNPMALIAADFANVALGWGCVGFGVRALLDPVAGYVAFSTDVAFWRDGCRGGIGAVAVVCGNRHWGGSGGSRRGG